MEMAEYKYPFHLHQRFDNFELFAAAVRGWDVDFRQLDCGDLQTEIKQSVQSKSSWEENI